jgi:hypothetical protein
MLLAQHHITLAIPMHFPFLDAPASFLNEPPAATADKLGHQLRDSGYWEEHQLLFFISMPADEKAWKSPKRHTGRDEVEIRYPVNYCFL